MIRTYPPVNADVDKVNAFYNGWLNERDSLVAAGQSIDILKMHMNEATIGASGAVFGLLFAYGYLFPNAEMIILPIPIPIKAKWLVAIYALFELSLGIQNSAGDNVAHFAHLGGMLFAFILLRIWRNKIRNRFY
jgi:membrane associated rhomboid family serine protease